MATIAAPIARTITVTSMAVVSIVIAIPVATNSNVNANYISANDDHSDCHIDSQCISCQ